MNSMKRQEDMTLEDELPRSEAAQYATGEVQRELLLIIASEKMKQMGKSGNKAHL